MPNLKRNLHKVKNELRRKKIARSYAQHNLFTEKITWSYLQHNMHTEKNQAVIPTNQFAYVKNQYAITLNPKVSFWKPFFQFTAKTRPFGYTLTAFTESKSARGV